MEKYFSPPKIKQLVETFSFSELRKLFTELNYMSDNKGLIEAFGLLREHGKSTINSFLFSLYSTLYNKSQFTLIISATEQIAVPFLDMIKSELEENQMLIEDFGIQKGNRWNNNEIWIKTSGGIDSCIMIRGIAGSLRGIH